MKFESGDKVKMYCMGKWWYGEITIADESNNTYKVLFPDSDGPEYWYYPEKDLESVIENKDFEL